MKKALALILLIATLSGCSSAGVSQSEYDAVVAERDALKAQVEQLLAEVPDEPETSSESVPAESGDVATRKNPAVVGDIITADLDSIVWGKCTFELTLVDVKRGQEAADMITAANSINDAAPEGKEYVVATFKFKNVKDLSEEDLPYDINAAQFSFCSGDFVKEDQFNMIAIDTDLSAEVFEDAETTGDVVFLADEGDNCYAVFDDTFWFSLAAE